MRFTDVLSVALAAQGVTASLWYSKAGTSELPYSCLCLPHDYLHLPGRALTGTISSIQQVARNRARALALRQ